MANHKLALLVLFALAVSACTPARFNDPLPAFHEARPRSILVVPVANHSVDVEAPTYVLSTLTRVIAEQGYYVFPVNTVKTLLEFEGLYEAAEVHRETTSELTELFGADAVLYVTIHDWRAEYVVLQTTTYVELEYKLVSGDNTLLWQARKRLSHSPNDRSQTEYGIGGVLASAVMAALERADPEYMKLTRQANEEVFTEGATALPPGPYSPAHAEYYRALEAAKAEAQAAAEGAQQPAGANPSGPL